MCGGLRAISNGCSSNAAVQTGILIPLLSGTRLTSECTIVEPPAPPMMHSGHFTSYVLGIYSEALSSFPQARNTTSFIVRHSQVGEANDSEWNMSEARFMLMPDGKGEPRIAFLSGSDPKSTATIEDVRFYLYTRDNRDEPEVGTINDTCRPVFQHFRSSRRTKVLVHGFGDSVADSYMVPLLKDASQHNGEARTDTLCRRRRSLLLYIVNSHFIECVVITHGYPSFCLMRLSEPQQGLRLAQHTFHQGELGSIPGGNAPGISQVRIVSDCATRRRVLSGISRSPHPCIPAWLHTHLASPSSAQTSSLKSTVTHSVPGARRLQCVGGRLEQPRGDAVVRRRLPQHGASGRAPRQPDGLPAGEPWCRHSQLPPAGLQSGGARRRRRWSPSAAAAHHRYYSETSAKPENSLTYK
ncbi:hypothetical protein PR048_023285 [Dryococelus australis]|uniref:Uncharacterized protein n=1 Tax=Dryococelus australis TaxID=614101 RepID=A0ABQ9GTN0_9NEOP|nr:hypothetical protein PR048_023285 [Dryococelus australis]